MPESRAVDDARHSTRVPAPARPRRACTVARLSCTSRLYDRCTLTHVHATPNATPTDAARRCCWRQKAAHRACACEPAMPIKGEVSCRSGAAPCADNEPSAASSKISAMPARQRHAGRKICDHQEDHAPPRLPRWSWPICGGASMATYAAHRRAEARRATSYRRAIPSACSMHRISLPFHDVDACTPDTADARMQKDVDDVRARHDLMTSIA